MDRRTALKTFAGLLASTACPLMADSQHETTNVVVAEVSWRSLLDRQDCVALLIFQHWESKKTLLAAEQAIDEFIKLRRAVDPGMTVTRRQTVPVEKRYLFEVSDPGRVWCLKVEVTPNKVHGKAFQECRPFIDVTDTVYLLDGWTLKEFEDCQSNTFHLL